MSDSLQQASAADTHILLIDDNPDDRELLARQLAGLGSEVRITAIADAAGLDAALQLEEFDLVITDYALRWSTGLEVLRRVKARDPTRPVVMFTASGSEELAVEAMKEGLDDYITKTARHYARIPLVVRGMLERREARRALARHAARADEDRREAERQLRVSEERFRAVQEASPDGFTVLEALRDAAGRIVDFTWTYVNAAAARMIRRPRGWLLGRRLLDVLPGNRPSGLFQHYVRAVETGEPWVNELAYEYDGLEMFARLAVARVGDGVAISTVDLSERRRAEEALVEAGRQKDEFLAMLAHELRNPLAPIRSSSEVLAAIVPREPRAQAMIEVLRRQVRHLSHLVDDLLDVSRITQGRIELNITTVDVADLLSHAVESVEPAIRERAHHLQILSSYRGLHVAGDAARLLQCLVNLLNNSIKYTDRGGRILVESREEDGQAVIEVSDNGTGISPHLMPRIFDLFVQSDRTLDRSQGGLGIGLSVVKRLIEMHGGTVAARSDGPGQGAVFTIRLPLAKHSGKGPPASVRGAPAPRRILVVDDNVDAADTLVTMLRLEGHEVEAVYRGRDALERTGTFRPQVVLLDIGLPELNGYEVARQLRKLPGAAELRLIALTGYGQAEDRARAFEAGFDDHLVKPVDNSVLRSHLAAGGRTRLP
jgi:signal transduction histidine kinase